MVSSVWAMCVADLKPLLASIAVLCRLEKDISEPRNSHFFQKLTSAMCLLCSRAEYLNPCASVYRENQIAMYCYFDELCKIIRRSCNTMGNKCNIKRAFKDGSSVFFLWEGKQNPLLTPLFVLALNSTTLQFAWQISLKTCSPGSKLEEGRLKDIPSGKATPERALLLHARRQNRKN